MTEYKIILDGLKAYEVEVVSQDHFLSVRGGVIPTPIDQNR